MYFIGWKGYRGRGRIYIEYRKDLEEEVRVVCMLLVKVIVGFFFVFI